MLLMKDAISIFVTAASRKEAKKIANHLVQQKLAACVQVLPGMESTYAWKKKICYDREVLLIIKSRKQLFSRLEKAIRKLHSYDVPQIVALPIIQGSSAYLQWMKSNLISK